MRWPRDGVLDSSLTRWRPWRRLRPGPRPRRPWRRRRVGCRSMPATMGMDPRLSCGSTKWDVGGPDLGRLTRSRGLVMSDAQSSGGSPRSSSGGSGGSRGSSGGSRGAAGSGKGGDSKGSRPGSSSSGKPRSGGGSSSGSRPPSSEPVGLQLEAGRPPARASARAGHPPVRGRRLVRVDRPLGQVVPPRRGSRPEVGRVRRVPALVRVRAAPAPAAVVAGRRTGAELRVRTGLRRRGPGTHAAAPIVRDRRAPGTRAAARARPGAIVGRRERAPQRSWAVGGRIPRRVIGRALEPPGPGLPGHRCAEPQWGGTPAASGYRVARLGRIATGLPPGPSGVRGSLIR